MEYADYGNGSLVPYYLLSIEFDEWGGPTIIVNTHSRGDTQRSNHAQWLNWGYLYWLKSQ